MYTIAARTARSSARRFPPPWGRFAATGINGCATCRRSSGAQVWIMSSTTSAANRRSCPRPQPHQL